MKLGILAAFITLLIVITRPYENIKYGQIDVYTFDKEYTEHVIEVYEPEEEDEDTLAEYFKKKYFEDDEWGK